MGWNRLVSGTEVNEEDDKECKAGDSNKILTCLKIRRK